MISYQADGIKMPAIKKRETTEWIKAVAASYEKRIGEIAYIFCSDEKILEVNRQYLQHDYYTDIITFDYCEGNRLSGDLFISLDTVRTNAEQFAGNDYASLQTYYNNLTDSSLLKLSDILANKCNERLGNWQAAIDWYENVINNPPSFT